MRIVRAIDFLKFHEKIYFSCVDRNGLYEYDVNHDKTILKHFFPNEDIWIENLHSYILNWNEKLIFIPLRGNNIHLYNVLTNEIEYYELPKICQGGYYKFSRAFLRGSKVFLLGHARPVILIFDLHKNEYKCIEDVVDKGNGMRGMMPFFGRDIVKMDNDIYIPNRHNADILVVDGTEEIRKIRVGEGDKGYALLCYDGTDFWCVDNLEHILVSWNEADGVRRQIKLPEEYCEGQAFWMESLCFNNELWLFQKNNIVFWDLKNEVFSSLALTNQHLDSFCSKKKIGQKIYILTQEGKMYDIDEKQCIRAAGEIAIDEDLGESMVLQEERNRGKLMREKNDRRFFLFLRQMQLGGDDIPDGVGRCGEDIYFEIKNSLTNRQEK